MMASTPSLTSLAIGAFVLLLLGSLLSPKRRRYPPGPRGWPLIGNILDMPSKEGWKVYKSWSTHFASDVLSIAVPGARIIILNSAEAIQELMVKRSSNYSDRPQSTMLHDMIKTTWMMVFMNYDARWKEHRRIFRREFENSTAESRAHEVNAARRLLKRLRTTTDHSEDLRLAAGDAIMSITYGVTPKTSEDPFLRTPEELMLIMTDVARGGYIIDVFPFLKHVPQWFPGAKFHGVAKAGRKLARDLLMAPYDHVKAQVAAGEAVPSVASRFLTAVSDGEPISEEEVETMRNVLGIAYLGGTDTSVSVLRNAVLALALYPNVQKKAQAALDAVLDGERLPDFSDYGRVPYLDAIVNEVLRWNPATPLGIFHASSEDDVYKGYDIPKGAIMIPNVWALLHDESVVGPNTDKFIPERFLNDDGQLKPEFLEWDAAFGFGRRSCPGKAMGRDTTWIIVASILAAYEICNPVDEHGNALTSESEIEFTNAIASFAPPFQVTFKLRVPESTINEGLDV